MPVQLRKKLSMQKVVGHEHDTWPFSPFSPSECSLTPEPSWLGSTTAATTSTLCQCQYPARMRAQTQQSEWWTNEHEWTTVNTNGQQWTWTDNNKREWKMTNMNGLHVSKTQHAGNKEESSSTRSTNISSTSSYAIVSPNKLYSKDDGDLFMVSPPFFVSFFMSQHVPTSPLQGLLQWHLRRRRGQETTHPLLPWSSWPEWMKQQWVPRRLIAQLHRKFLWGPLTMSVRFRICTKSLLDVCHPPNNLQHQYQQQAFFKVTRRNSHHHYPAPNSKQHVRRISRTPSQKRKISSGSRCKPAWRKSSNSTKLTQTKMNSGGL